MPDLESFNNIAEAELTFEQDQTLGGPRAHASCLGADSQQWWTFYILSLFITLDSNICMDSGVDI